MTQPAVIPVFTIGILGPPGAPASLTETALGNSGDTVSVNWATSPVQAVVLTTNAVNVAFLPPVSAAFLQLRVSQDATGGREINWPAILWEGKSPPTLSTAPNAQDLIGLFWNGTSFYGWVKLNFG
jgi:hypothetical protein